MARKSADYIHMYLEHGIDIPGRTIHLTSYADSSGEEAGVDWQLTDRVLKGLRLMPHTDVPITLLINNFGGEDDHARAIIAGIRHCPSAVHGVVYGRAESAAAWILQACDYRTMDTNSDLMFHLGASAKDAHSAHIDELFITDIYTRILEKNAKYPRARLTKKLHTDWYVYAPEALELGLVDEVLE